MGVVAGWRGSFGSGFGVVMFGLGTGSRMGMGARAGGVAVGRLDVAGAGYLFDGTGMGTAMAMAGGFG